MKTAVSKLSSRNSVKFIAVLALTASCLQQPEQATHPTQPVTPPPRGVVTYFNDVPAECPTGKGLKQTVVKRVTSEKDMIRHYGMTFRVRFQDKVTPELYGALYYQDKGENMYCMALPDGRFATFRDSQVGEHQMNIAQEVCYPLQACN